MAHSTTWNVAHGRSEANLHWQKTQLDRGRDQQKHWFIILSSFYHHFIIIFSTQMCECFFFSHNNRWGRLYRSRTSHRNISWYKHCTEVMSSSLISRTSVLLHQICHFLILDQGQKCIGDFIACRWLVIKKKKKNICVCMWPVLQRPHLLMQQKATRRKRSAKLRPEPSNEKAAGRQETIKQSE